MWNRIRYNGVCATVRKAGEKRKGGERERKWGGFLRRDEEKYSNLRREGGHGPF